MVIDEPPGVQGRAWPGGIEVRLLISASMSLSALAIELMLSSFPRIRTDTHGGLLPNLDAAALRPMGALAGTAAAVVGTVSMLGGSIIGALLSGTYDRTTLPLSLGFVGCGAVAAALAATALRAPAAEAVQVQATQATEVDEPLAAEAVPAVG